MSYLSRFAAALAAATSLVGISVAGTTLHPSPSETIDRKSVV